MFNALLNALIDIDKSLTVFLNYDGGPMQDILWYSLSSRLIWIPIGMALILYLMRDIKKWKEALAIVLAIAVIITLCDQISSSVMKPYFARLRPSHTPGVENLLHYVNGYHGGKYGFA